MATLIRSVAAPLAVMAALSLSWLSPAQAALTLTWSEVFDQTVTSTPAQTLTRSLRGLALSSDGGTLYGGFIQKSQGSGVREYSLAGDPPTGSPGGFLNVTNFAPSGDDHQPKAVATDSRGVVYIGSSKDSTSGHNARVIVANANLTTSLMIPLADVQSNPVSDPNGYTRERVEGLSVREVAGQVQLYASRHHGESAWLERYVVGGTGAGDATLTLDSTFGSGGRFAIHDVINGANALHGLEVADDGTIFVASRNTGTVYRISSDLSTVDVASVANAMDLALFDGRLFVTQYDGANSSIAELLQSDLSLLSTFDAFALFPHDADYGDVAGYAGIDIDAQGRIYLVDQLYYRSSTESRDRVLVSSPLALLNGAQVPEPGNLLLCLGGLGVLGTASIVRRRRRNSGK